MKSNKGFSLVELIVVIAIMAVIAAVAIPVYSGYITKTEEAVSLSAVNDIVYAVKLANLQFFTTVSNAEIADDEVTVTVEFSGEQREKAAEHVTDILPAATCENSTVTLVLENSLGSKFAEATAILAEIVIDNDVNDNSGNDNSGNDDAGNDDIGDNGGNSDNEPKVTAQLIIDAINAELGKSQYAADPYFVKYRGEGNTFHLEWNFMIKENEQDFSNAMTGMFSGNIADNNIAYDIPIDVEFNCSDVFLQNKDANNT